MLSSIKFGRLKKATLPWHKYLEGKKLLLFDYIGDTYLLIGIYGENNGLDGLCEYEWEHDPEGMKKDIYNYKTLKSYKENVYLGNDGFGFDKDEIELCHLEG